MGWIKNLQSFYIFHTVQLLKPLRSKFKNCKECWIQNILMKYFAVTQKMSLRPLRGVFKVLFDVFCGKVLIFKHQPDKMVKHTQTICWLLPTNCLSVFDYFVRLVLKELNSVLIRLETIRGAFTTQSNMELITKKIKGRKSRSWIHLKWCSSNATKYFRGYIFLLSHILSNVLYNQKFSLRCNENQLTRISWTWS